MLVSATFGLAVRLCAQSPDSFNPDANYGVQAIVVQRDGKVLVGGYFSTLGGQVRNGLGRLHADGTLDASFHPELASCSQVQSLALQADGKILVQGTFPILAGRTNCTFGRLNEDGRVDDSFNPGFEGSVAFMTLQADGEILVGGTLSRPGESQAGRVIRLNPDGALDAGFNSGAYQWIASLALQADGKVLVGSGSDFVGQWPRYRLDRLKPDGTFDGSFNSYEFDSPSLTCALAVQRDGKILIGGGFSAWTGLVWRGLDRLNPDGTLDSTFKPAISGAAVSGEVYSMAVQADGKILVAGSFTNLCGQTCNHLGRLNADGTLDTTFNAGADGWVSCCVVHTNGQILIGGGFYSLNGQPRRCLGRLNALEPATQVLSFDGASLTWLTDGAFPEISCLSFDIATNGSSWINLGIGVPRSNGWTLSGLNLVTNVSLRASGRVTGGEGNGSSWLVQTSIGMPMFLAHPSNQTNNAGAAAVFTVVAGGPEPISFRWQKDGTDLMDGGNVSGAHTPTLTLDHLLEADAAGYTVVLSNASGVVTSRVARLTVVDPFIDQQPLSLAVTQGQTAVLGVAVAGTSPVSYEWRKDGTILAGVTDASLCITNVQPTDRGTYDVVVSNAFGIATSAPAWLTVITATTDSFDSAADDAVLAFGLQPDGKILVGGNFTTLCGQSRKYIARLRLDGALDAGFVPDANGMVDCMVVQADGKIVLGGGFSMLGSLTTKGLGRLNSDGTVDAQFTPGADGRVNCLFAQSDGRILVAGWFTRLGNLTRNYLARLNADGSVDTTFNSWADASVSGMAVQPDGRILVGGNFTHLGSSSTYRPYLGRLNPDGTVDSGFNPGADGPVGPLVVQSDDKILAGGGFLSVAGDACPYLVRLNSDGAPDPVFKPSPNGPVSTIALQADGKVLVGGSFTTIAGQPCFHVARLNPDGTLDTAFTPAADGAVSALALQPDGKVLVGGTFTTLAGQPRACLGRLNNTEPAVQTLGFDGSTVTWLRSGAAPELWSVAFDASTNGVDWSSLGVAARISGLPGGWQLANVSVPSNSVIRARGFATGGLGNGSSWLVESLFPDTPPAIVVSDGHFGFNAGLFGFNLTGRPGQVTVIEASTNLADWIALSTNTFGAGSFYFVDSNATNYPARYYRARAVGQ